MFHAISAWLTRQGCKIRDTGLAHDNAIAFAHRWNTQQVKPRTWSYRDSRFIYLAFKRTQPSTGCTWCDDKIAEWLYDLAPDTSNRIATAWR